MLSNRCCGVSNLVLRTEIFVFLCKTSHCFGVDVAVSKLVFITEIFVFLSLYFVVFLFKTSHCFLVDVAVYQTWFSWQKLVPNWDKLQHLDIRGGARRIHLNNHCWEKWATFWECYKRKPAEMRSKMFCNKDLRATAFVEKLYCLPLSCDPNISNWCQKFLLHKTQ